ncbi:hypothetical protein [Pararhizobium sp.]|uniref:hypothetical protein n=1 Tax=Pararhizobium sp. TaxID=1977563 RepID=UPI003D11F733
MLNFNGKRQRQMIFIIVVLILVVMIVIGGKVLVRDRPDPPPENKVPFSLPDEFWINVEKYEDYLIQRRKITTAERASWRAKFEDKLKHVEQYRKSWGRSPYICYSRDGSRVILVGGTWNSVRTHELLHLYQEVIFGVLTKEKNKELKFIDQIMIEIEVNRFSTPLINVILLALVVAVAFVIGIAFFISYA